MVQESKQWVYASKRVNKTQSGGIHVYIDSDTLHHALENTNISSNKPLMIMRYPLKGNKNNAKILIKIKERI